MAVDYGTKNVGLACCDELGITVRPLASMPNRGRKDLVGKLRSLMAKHEIHRIVVGIPLRMDGSAGEAVRRVERIMKHLHEDLGVPLAGFDERLSTTEAAELWQQMNLRQRRKYRTVDSLAAALILERYLRES